MYRKILVATDGSERSRHAVEHALALARGMQSAVVATFVIDTRVFPGAHPILAQSQAPQYFQLMDELRQGGDQALREATEAGARASVSVKTEMTEGTPAEEIVALAERDGADLIVVGTHGRTGLDAVLLGSTAQAVVHAASCPVLLVR